MDFTSISNMNRYLKTINMNHIWKQNANNPAKSVIPGSPSKASGETYQSAGSFGDERLMNIKTKLKSGQELSSSDLDYLREKYPAEYDEVLKMEREKKEYEKELSRCKTKNDARILHIGKVTESLSALKSGGDADMILAKLAKMTKAYEKFTESARYSKLAENYMELAEAIEAEKEAITGEKEPAEPEQKNDRNEAPTDNGLHEPQGSPVQSEQASDPADDKPVPQSSLSDKSISVETGKQAPAPKIQTGKTAIEVKPASVQVRAIALESYDVVPVAQSTRGKLDSHA